VRDLATGETAVLARRTAPGGGEAGTGYRFDPRGFALARRAIRRAPVGGVLVADELGPLELRGGGHMPAVREVLGAGRPAAAVLVVRRALVPSLLALLGGTDAVVVDTGRVEDPVAEMLEALTSAGVCGSGRGRGRSGMPGGAIVPAAGASRRFGGIKLLEPAGGEPLLGRTVRVVLEAGFSPVVVVLGAYRERLEPALAPYPVEVVANPSWREGMGASIAAGVRAFLALAPEAAGAAVVPADLPALEPAILAALPRAAAGAGLPAAAVTWEGAPLQAPAWFSREILPELLRLEGDRGARALLRARPEAVAAVRLEAPLCDLDRPADSG